MQSSWRNISLCLLGLGTALLSGCGGGGGSSSGGGAGGGGTSGGGGGTPTPKSLSAQATDGLTATLTESNSTVTVGGTITYTLTLTNNTAVSIEINSASASPKTPSAALQVKNSSGTVVYNPIPGPPPLDTASLATGQSLTETQSVQAFASAGTYSASAIFSDPPTPVTVSPLTITAK